MMRPLLIAALIAALPACSHDPAPQAAATRAASSAIAAVPETGLPPQRLGPGKCGLFLWGMSAPRQFVFFSESPQPDALILLDGKPASLPMTGAGGDVFGQFVTRMNFEDAASRTKIEVTLKPGEMLEGGQRVESGNLVFRTAEGWETVLPVTGVRACMPG